MELNKTINPLNHEALTKQTSTNLQSISPSLVELNKLIAEFIEFKQLKPNSQRAYRVDLFYFTQFYVTEKIDLIKIPKSKVLIWLQQYSGRAANRRGVNTRQFMLWLKEYKGFLVNPEWQLSWKFTDPKPQKPDRAAELEEEDVQQLLHSKSIDLNKRAIIGLFISSGASLEEMAELRWENLHLGKLPHLTIGERGRERVIPMEDEVAELVRELKQYTIQNNEMNEKGFVFLEKKSNESIKASYMAMIIRRSAERVLDRQISPTQLHEYAKQRLIKRFEQIDFTLELLGKKNATSLIRIDEEKIDLKKLKDIHASAFAE